MADALEKQILDHPIAGLALLLGKIVPIIAGIALLMLWFLKQDKIKGGVLPRPPPAAPTRAFPLGAALLWTVLGMCVAPSLLVVALAGGAPLSSRPTWHTILAMGVPMGLTAVFLLVRRARVQRTTPEALRQRLGPDAPIPTRPPGLLRAFVLGLWGLCVAGVIVVPVRRAWALVLTSLGAEAVAQGPVQQLVDRGAPDAAALLMVAFGVLVAPFTEECIFRGMLYPGVKRAFGGGRRAAWIGALLVSALFAGVHGNLYALLPLFALALVLNWVFETTNSLAASIFIHALHNGLTMVPLLILRYSP